MKKLTLIMLFSIGLQTLQAQTYNEMFRQKKTKIQYLLQQMAGLEIYINYSRKGYDIARKGLSTLGQLKNGDYQLHRNFFQDLSLLNPSISKLYPSLEFLQKQKKLFIRLRELKQFITNNQEFQAVERQYFQQVLKRLESSVEHQLDILLLIVSEDDLEMEDQERLQRLKQVLQGMQDDASFLQLFEQDLRSLSAERLLEWKEWSLPSYLEP